ncbi:MAG: alpha/beta hydrolase [Chitinophagaceae bacterium]|nr:alpha/beta hydrolase [Chitinophagaceae bacterium]
MDFKHFKHAKCFVNGIRIHVRYAGKGQAVLLMHGWLGTSYSWRHVAPKLIDAGYQVICPDMRGNGDSDKPISGYDGLTLVEDMRQLLFQLGVTGKVHVAGWDMGALPAYLFAATYPNETTSLTYIDEPLPSVNLHTLTTFTKENFGGFWHFGFNSADHLPELLIGGKERQFWNFLYSLMLFNPASITEEDKDEYMRTYAAAGGIRGSLGWYKEALVTTDQFAAAIAKGKLSMPVMGIGGQYGTPYTQSQLSVISDNVHGGIIPECGHMVAEEQPDALVKYLLEFFNA